MFPVSLVVDEVTHHVECSSRLVSRHHVAGSIHKHKPQISRGLCPTLDFSMDGPDVLGSTFPLRDSFPVQAVEVLEHTSSVDHKVVLPVVNEGLHIPEC